MLQTRRSRLASVFGLAGALAMVGAGAAIADDHQAPSTKPAMATFSATVQTTHVTTCQGGDGTYHDDRTVSTGTSSGSDPRLSGKITIASHSLINITTGYGTSTGIIVVRDATTNKVLSRAAFSAVNTFNGVLHGFEIGRLDGTSTLPAATLFANFSAIFNNAGTAFAGTLGSATDSTPPPTEPAVIQSGSCAGGEKGSHR